MKEFDSVKTQLPNTETKEKADDFSAAQEVKTAVNIEIFDFRRICNTFVTLDMIIYLKICFLIGF